MDYRTTTGVEVDFVLYGKHGFFAFEIKRKRNLSKRDLNGLLAFKADYPEAKLFLLYGGRLEEVEQGIQIMPYETALKNLKEMIS